MAYSPAGGRERRQAWHFGHPLSEAIQATAGEQRRIDIGLCTRHGSFDTDWTDISRPTTTLSEPTHR